MRVHMLAAASTAVAVLLAVAGSGEPAWGAVDLDVVINMDVDFAQFRVTYSDRTEYAYGEGSLLHQHLGGRQWVVEGTASEDRDVQKLENMLNDYFGLKSGSPKISVSDAGYEFRLEPASYGSAMERTVWITGNLTGYIASTTVRDMSTDYAAPAREGNAPASPLGTRQAWVAYATDCTGFVPSTLVNIRWLSPTVTGKIVIDGVPINIPANLLREMEPEAYYLLADGISIQDATGSASEMEPEAYYPLAGTEANTILTRPLMDAGPIRDQHADAWHVRHYPAGTSVEADTFGLSGGVTDVDIFTWTIDVDDPGIWTKGIDVVDVTLDQTYVIRSTHDTSSAMIRTIGSGVFDTIGNGEIVTDFPYVPGCQSNVNFKDASQIMSAFIAFILAAIIAWMLIAARRRDRRLQRNDGGRQAGAEVPP